MRDDAVPTIEHAIALLVRLVTATRPRDPVVASLDRSAYLILSRLYGRDPVAITALAEEFMLDVSTLSRQVSALERKGLLRRVDEAGETRGRLLAITTAGTKQFLAVRAARREVYAAMLQSWSAEERQALQTSLARLTADLRKFLQSRR